MKNIVFFGHSSNYSGAEITLYEILMDLKLRNSFKLHLILPSFGGAMYAQYKNLGINCVEVPFPWTKTPRSFFNYLNYPQNKMSLYKFQKRFRKQLVPLVKNLSPNLIFSNTSVFPWGSITANALDIAHIWSIREDISNQSTFINLDTSHTGVNEIYESSKIVYLPSKQIQNRLKLNQENLNKTKILYTIPKFQMPDEISESNYLRDSRLRIAWVGSYNKNKNPFTLLKAARILKNRGANFLISFYGEGELRSKMIDFVTKSNLVDFVKIGPHHQDLSQIFNLNNICVSTTKNEAFGRTLAEGANFGLIPVYPDKSSWEERFTPNLNSLSFDSVNTYDLAEKLLSLSDINYRQKLSSALVSLAKRNYDFQSPGSIVSFDIEKLVK